MTLTEFKSLKCGDKVRCIESAFGYTGGVDKGKVYTIDFTYVKGGDRLLVLKEARRREEKEYWGYGSWRFKLEATKIINYKDKWSNI